MKDSSPTPPASGWNAAIEACARIVEAQDGMQGWKRRVAHAIRSLTRPDSPGWQTIDSAPKDGTAILGYDPTVDARVVISWDGYWRVRWNRDENPDCTHWCPLPEPPSPREGE